MLTLPDCINVRECGALGDGIHDDAPAIQTALSRAAAQGGTVYLPAGVYRMAAGVTVPFGVNVTGITTAVTGPWQNYLDTADKGFPLSDGIRLDTVGENWIDPKLFKGTWVICDHGIGDPQGEPTFRLEGGTSISRIGFVNRCLPPVTETVTPCPPCIAHFSENALPYTREGVTVEDISLANCYYGIVLAAGRELESGYPELSDPSVLSKSCGRHRIHNIMGGPVYRGIVLKNLLDTVDIHNCQFNYSCYVSTYCAARSLEGVDIWFSRGDGMNMQNILSYGARHALLTEPSFKNNMGTCSFRLSNVNFEGLEPLVLHSGGMYEIANSYFLGCPPCGYGAGQPITCCTIRQPENCIHNPFIVFSGCVFQLCAPGRHIEAEQFSGCNPSFVNCQFWGYDSDRALIRMRKHGKAAGSLTLSDCVVIGRMGTENKPSEMPGTLAEADGAGYHDGDLRFVHCRFPDSLLNDTSRRGIWYDGCVVFDDEGENHRISIGSFC